MYDKKMRQPGERDGQFTLHTAERFFPTALSSTLYIVLSVTGSPGQAIEGQTRD